MNINKTLVKKIALLTGGITLGFVTGYSISAYRGRKEFDAALQAEIDEFMEQHLLIRKDGVTPMDILSKYPEDLTEQLNVRYGKTGSDVPIYDEMVREHGDDVVHDAILEQYRDTPVFEEETGETKLALDTLREKLASGPSITNNVFIQAAQEQRTGDKPYIISVQEFHEDNLEYDKLTITYYEGDDTLADERDQPVDNVSYVLGDDALSHFGERSDDPNIVYVRNDTIGTDFEVQRSKRGFAQEVYGVSPDKPKPQKMREADDS